MNINKDSELYREFAGQSWFENYLKFAVENLKDEDFEKFEEEHDDIVYHNDVLGGILSKYKLHCEDYGDFFGIGFQIMETFLQKMWSEKFHVPNEMEINFHPSATPKENLVYCVLFFELFGFKEFSGVETQGHTHYL